VSSSFINVIFVYSSIVGVQDVFHARWCSCRLTVTRRVDQKLLTLPEHLSSRFFSGVRVAQSLIFCIVFGRSLFVLFLLAIVLPVLFRFTASD